MTKILMITPSFYPAFHYGGPIYSTYESAKALKKTGVDVRVITTNANGKEKLKISLREVKLLISIKHQSL